MASIKFAVTTRMIAKDALGISEEELQALERKPEAEILALLASLLGEES